MEVVDDVLGGNAILQNVDPENRDLFREKFMDDESDEEFTGFNPEDFENDEDTIDFEEDFVQGNMDARNLQFRGEKKINVEIDENAEMVDFFKLYVTDEFIDETLVQETNKYAQDFLNSAQGQNLKPPSRFHK